MKTLLKIIIALCFLIIMPYVAFAGANKSYTPYPILNTVTGTTPFPRTGYVLIYFDENETPTLLFPSGATSVLGVTPFVVPSVVCAANEVWTDDGTGIMSCAALSGIANDADFAPASAITPWLVEYSGGTPFVAGTTRTGASGFGLDAGTNITLTPSITDGIFTVSIAAAGGGGGGGTEVFDSAVSGQFMFASDVGAGTSTFGTFWWYIEDGGALSGETLWQMSPSGVSQAHYASDGRSEVSGIGTLSG